jgi:hypothetical protein
MIRAALVLKSLHIHKIIGFSPALAKHLPTRKVEHRSIRFLAFGHEVAALRVVGRRKGVQGRPARPVHDAQRRA